MRTLAALSLTVVALACRDAPVSETRAGMERQVDALFADLDRDDAPGAAVLVVHDGDVVYRKGFGLANLEHGVPITPSTVFDIASVSKQFAGMSIAMLVEEGRIGLRDDIRSHLPELPDFGPTVTVDHLVHHTGGLRDWPGTLAVGGWRMDDVISFDQILRMARNQRDLNFEPGAEYSYSNTGYNVLAELVGRVSGRSFREWTDERIFRPLRMRDTHFHDDHTELVPNRARGYARTDGGFTNVPNGLTALGSSSLYTTADDLARWVANFDDGRVGGPAVIRRMERRGLLNDGDTIAYAFGQSLVPYRGIETWTHSGSWAGFRTVLTRVPEHRLGVVILSNRGDYDPSARARDVIDLYLAEWLEPEDGTGPAGRAPREAVEVSGALLDEYAGTYRLGPGWYVTITRSGASLQAQATDEPRFPMTAVSDVEFWVEAYGASMTFGRNPSATVDHLSYRDLRAPRIDMAAAAGAPDPASLVGEYYSPELDTSYRLVQRDGALVASHARHGEIELTHVLGDEFRGSAWFVPALELDRDGRGRVVGFRISQGRSRNIRFEGREGRR